MQITIHTYDRELAYKLLGKSEICVGDVIDVGQGVSLVYDGRGREYKGVETGLPGVIMLTAAFTSTVAAHLLAMWIWEKLRGEKVAQLEIDRVTIELDEGVIKRVIREKIRKGRRNAKD